MSDIVKKSKNKKRKADTDVVIETVEEGKKTKKNKKAKIESVAAPPVVEADVPKKAKKSKKDKAGEPESESLSTKKMHKSNFQEVRNISSPFLHFL